MTEPNVIFSVKYCNPEYPDEIWAADWDWQTKRAWGISRSPSHKIAWEIVKMNIDRLAHQAILEKFGLLEWKKEYPPIMVEMMSPADLVFERREKEKEYKLPSLEITSDNIYGEAGKGQIPQHAEDYD